MTPTPLHAAVRLGARYYTCCSYVRTYENPLGRNRKRQQSGMHQALMIDELVHGTALHLLVQHQHRPIRGGVDHFHLLERALRFLHRSRSTLELVNAASMGGLLIPEGAILLGGRGGGHCLSKCCLIEYMIQLEEEHCAMSTQHNVMRLYVVLPPSTALLPMSPGKMALGTRMSSVTYLIFAAPTVRGLPMSSVTRQLSL